MAHNRKSSSGKSNNASHPFEYGEKGDRLFFMHNGTITNIQDICKEYNYPYEAGKTIDSYVIGYIIYHNGIEECKKLFKDYSGGAVFIFYWENNPNELYMFKGESTYSTAPGTTGNEERPLWLYHEDEYNMYFVSQSRSGFLLLIK